MSQTELCALRTSDLRDTCTAGKPVQSAETITTLSISAIIHYFHSYLILRIMIRSFHICLECNIPMQITHMLKDLTIR